MECMHCGAQWILKDEQTKFAICPFCGKELEFERTDKRYTDFQEALKAIAQMRGIDYLISEPSKVLAIFLDITQNLQKEHKLLKVFYSNDTQKYFKNASKPDEGRFNRAVRSLQEDVFMEAESAKYIVTVFADVLGIKKETDISIMDISGTAGVNRIDSEERQLAEEKEKNDSISNISVNSNSISFKRTQQDRSFPLENIKYSDDMYLQQLVDKNEKGTSADYGRIFALGRRILQDSDDYQKAVKYIKYAAQHGLSEASFLLGYCYAQGIGVSQNASTAVAYYRQGAISNKNYAQYIDKYGGLLNNEGVAKAAKEGKRIFEEKEDCSADIKRDDSNLISTEKMQQQNQEFPPENINYSDDKYLQQLVDKNEKGTSADYVRIFELGRSMFQEGDFLNAIRYVRYAAQHGLDEANLLLGYCYDQGIGLSRNMSAAIAYYRQGVISNKNYAQYNLNLWKGYSGLNDEWIAKAAEEGKKIFERKGDDGLSIKSGNSNSIDNMSYNEKMYLQQLVDNNEFNTFADVDKIFELGRSMLQDGDYQKAIKYIKYAASHGSNEGCLLLAYCYEQGIGVNKDADQAEVWKTIASMKLAIKE